MANNLALRARGLAERHLSDVPRRWAHVRGVADSTNAVASVIDPDRADALVAAAWLHDIGYAADLANTGFHPVDGARFARGAGMPELVVQLVAFHTGAEFEAQQRGLLDELHEFMPPPRELLDIVTYADMTTATTGEPIDARDRVAEILTRYEPEDPVFAAVSQSAPELLAAVDRVTVRLQRTAASRAHPR